MAMAALALAAVPARAAGKTVALVPVRAVRSGAQSEKPLTEALRANLQKHGYEVLPEETVDRWLKEHKVDLTKPQSIETMRMLADATGADYVVYPRLLSVGRPLGEETPQATILVNVLAKGGRQYLHTRQIGQRFAAGPGGQMAMPPSAAAEAAEKLLDGFYKKAEKR
jgi:hypothetical protein